MEFISGNGSLRPGNAGYRATYPRAAGTRHKVLVIPRGRAYDVQMGVRTKGVVAIAAAIVLALFGGFVGISARQTPVVRPVDEKALREYAGVYQWGPNAFVYLQMWDEFSGFGKPQLVAFDESGDVRTLVSD